MKTEKTKTNNCAKRRLAAGQYPIIEKAFALNLDKIEEGYLHSDYTCLAKDRNEAKGKLLEQLKYDDLLLKHTDTPMTYLNMPIMRIPQGDRVMFENEIVRRGDIEQILYKKQRLSEFQTILDDSKITHCFIKRHGSYYRPGWAGYTGLEIRAGVYEKAEAIAHAKSVEDIFIIAIDNEAHNVKIRAEVDELTERLLPCC